MIFGHWDDQSSGYSHLWISPLVTASSSRRAGLQYLRLLSATEPMVKYALLRQRHGDGAYTRAIRQRLVAETLEVYKIANGISANEAAFAIVLHAVKPAGPSLASEFS
jgi:hypothetical protein